LSSFVPLLTLQHGGFIFKVRMKQFPSYFRIPPLSLSSYSPRHVSCNLGGCESQLVQFLADHISEAGDNGAFKASTFAAAAAHIASFHERGPVKSTIHCTKSTLKEREEPFLPSDEGINRVIHIGKADIFLVERAT
jgi:hypothetical protein